MVDIEKLREFLITAKKKGYAAGSDIEAAKDVMITKDGDGSTTIHYRKGNWRYVDCYFGNKSFGGNEIVFYEEKAVWMMNYSGGILPTVDDGIVISFLRRMLMMCPFDNPFRGPKGGYIEGQMEYTNNVIGDIKDFNGIERLLMAGQKIHEVIYFGRLITY